MTRRLLLVDDHPLFVDGFAAMLWQFRPDWVLHLANTVATGKALIGGESSIELAIVDIQLPDGDGFSTVADMLRINPALSCIIISGREDAAAHRRAAACGASGFIGKTDTPEGIIQGIEQVLAGQRLFDQAVFPSSIPPMLSARQSEVLALLAQGHANKEIRYRLGIAERTVRAHLTDLFGLLGATSRVQAIVKARQMGLID